MLAAIKTTKNLVIIRGACNEEGQMKQQVVLIALILFIAAITVIVSVSAK